MELIKIYTLSNPITGEIKYIGQTKNTLIERLRGHIKDKRRTYKTNWIESLKKKGLTPKIELIEEVEKADGSFAEQFWIMMFKFWGFKLCNLTEGGDTSTTKHVVRTKIWCENISKGKLKSNFRYSEESRKQMSNSAKLRPTFAKGEQLSKLKLTEDEVINIKTVIKNRGKKTLKLLSTELNLPYTFLIDLNTNRTWKHIN